jgi:hypothetical protein
LFAIEVETLGEAYRLSWRVRARCIHGTIETPVRLQRCEYTAELDMQTLVWAKGLRFPLGRLGSRLMCPRCGTRDVNVIFEPPTTAIRVAGR